jgi:hypothetical protein
MLGGTDHDHDRETYRERAEDIVYDVRAWSQSISWSVVLGGLGAALTGWAQHDTALLASGVTALVVAFLPRARPAWIGGVVRTWAMARGWTAVPAEERPLRTPDEILSERVRARPAVEVRRRDES